MSQTLVPPPRTSSREPPPIAERGQNAGLDAGQEETGVAGQTPADNTASNVEGVNDQAETSSRRSRRSIVGRKRDRSAASKRSGQPAVIPSEKVPRPDSSGRSQQDTQQSSRRKGGLLAFLNCCSPREESHEPESVDAVEPAKPSTKSQPTRVQPPSQSRMPQSVNTTNTSVDDTNEIMDEKTAQHTYANASNVDSSMAGREPEKITPADGALDKPMPSLPSDAAVHPNPAMAPLASTQLLVPENATTGRAQNKPLPPTDPSSSGRINSPTVEVQAPTPVVQQEEGEPIFDRTPEQKQMDDDIEMTDHEPNLPLSGDDAAQIERETSQKETQDTETYGALALPPPPPVSTRNQQAGDGSNVSHEGSIQSTEQTQKWLLPPISAELRGRKCLVLDLDETLVHSSFKVSYFFILFFQSHHTHQEPRSSITRTSQFPWRSKASITTFT